MSHLRRAMILAAGLGTRMAPLTLETPKPLVKLGGKPLIDYAIERLVAGGVDFIVVNVHYKADQLIAHIDRKRKELPKVKFVISDETEELLDTGAGVKKALPLFEGEAFLTYNSDSLWIEGMGSSLTRMQSRWNPETMDALMLLAPCATAIGYDGRGDFEMDAWGRLKRRPEMNIAPFVWTGVQIVQSSLFQDAPEGRFSINRQWDRSMSEGRLWGVRLDGVWIHVGTPQGLEEAEEFLRDLARAP
ncbi:MAG TPA: nucleotidyltransferase family protein [Micropepsaceae bacterium]|nr:nucleotidyltransferase family protein [Micropepsaceae bacterium]